jgi:hypothetical protein
MAYTIIGPTWPRRHAEDERVRSPLRALSLVSSVRLQRRRGSFVDCRRSADRPSRCEGRARHDKRPPPIDGTRPESELVRPLRTSSARYDRYSHAVRDVARPRLFENRPSWRLTNASFDGGSARLAFGDMTYFDAMDVCEAIAHETAAGLVVNGTSVAPPTWRGLKLRRAVGDPFDLRRRAPITSINTLTIRLDKSATARSSSTTAAPRASPPPAELAA